MLLICAPVFHSQIKHLVVDFHFVHNLFQYEVLRVTHVSSYDQLADVLTKPLPDPRLHDLCAKIDIASETVLCGVIRINYF